MVNVFHTGQINENGSVDITELNGEIIKIIVFCENKVINAKLKIESNDAEILCDDYLTENITRFYPKNVVKVTQEMIHLDNYFVYGALTISVEGLGDKELINNISIYYK
jgi:hypothetical protein